MSGSARWLLALLLVLLPVSASSAADVEVVRPGPPPRVVEVPPPAVEVVPPPPPVTGPLAPPPRVQYGCKRVWRCDTTICEWRRGCWGVYGYVEGPYYTSTFARRQWEAHGWPSPRGPRY